MRDDEAARRPVTHQFGDRLDDLSVADLDRRIAELQQEIARLEADKQQKQSAVAAAAAFFKT